jgi:hypothetical protein
MIRDVCILVLICLDLGDLGPASLGYGCSVFCSRHTDISYDSFLSFDSFLAICLKEDYLRPPKKRNIFDIHAYSLGKEKGVCVCSERKVSVFCKEEKVFAIMV